MIHIFIHGLFFQVLLSRPKFQTLYGSTRCASVRTLREPSWYWLPKEYCKWPLNWEKFCFYMKVLIVVCLYRHDTVFIDLTDKPEWYLNIFPSGLVPCVYYKGNFLSESLLLADFLDEQYSQPPLWYDDPLQKILDKIFIQSFGKVRAWV